jgi:hypothetical protein
MLVGFAASSRTLRHALLFIYKLVTTHLNATLKITLKIIGLIILLIFLYFIESIIFWMIFGEGGQASSIMNNGLTKLIMYVIPFIIVSGIAFKVFKKD